MGRTWAPIQNQHILNQWFHTYPLELWKKKHKKIALACQSVKIFKLTSATICLISTLRQAHLESCSIHHLDSQKNPTQLCIFDHFGHDGSMGRTVYLPTWIVDLYGINVGKYTVRPMDESWVLDDFLLDVFSTTCWSRDVLTKTFQCQLSRLACGILLKDRISWSQTNTWPIWLNVFWRKKHIR